MHFSHVSKLGFIRANAGEYPPDWRQAADIRAEFAGVLRECNLAIATRLVYSDRQSVSAKGRGRSPGSGDDGPLVAE